MLNQARRDGRGHPRGTLHVPVAAGILALSVGAIVLAAALMRGPAERPEGAEAFEREIATLRSTIDQQTERLRGLNDQYRGRLAEIQGGEGAEKDLAAHVETRSKEVESLERNRQTELDQAKASVQESFDKGKQEWEKAKEVLKAKEEQEHAGERLAELLEESKPIVATIASEKGPVATGFNFAVGNVGAAIVTSKYAVKDAGKIFVKFKYQSEGAYRVAVCRGVVRYIDESSGLAFLIPDLSAARVRVNIKAWGMDRVDQVRAGDGVYTIGTQVMGDEAFEHTVLDGSIANTSREFNGQKYLQLDLPANEGTMGAPIFTAKGKLVGVLVTALPDMEKTSVAIPATVLQGAIERYLVATGQAPAPADAGNPVRESPPNRSNQARPFALNNRSRPDFKKEDTQSYFATSIMEAGPDGLLLTESMLNGQWTLAACTRGGMPVWSYPSSERSEIHRLILRDDAQKMLLFIENKKFTPVEIDLKTGAKEREFPGLDSTTLGPITEYYVRNNLLITITNNSLHSIFDISAGKPIAKMKIPELVYLSEDTFYGQKDRGFYTCGIDKVGSIMRQFGALEAEGRDIEKRDNPDGSKPLSDAQRKNMEAKSGLWKELDSALSKAWSKGFNPGKAIWSFKRLAGKGLVAYGLNVYKAEGGGIQLVASVDAPDHSGFGSLWYREDWKDNLSKGVSIIAGSPDGRLVVTQTHIYDIQSKRVVGELPVPTDKATFLSDSRTLVIYEYEIGRLIWLTIE